MKHLCKLSAFVILVSSLCVWEKAQAQNETVYDLKSLVIQETQQQVDKSKLPIWILPFDRNDLDCIVDSWENDLYHCEKGFKATDQNQHQFTVTINVPIRVHVNARTAEESYSLERGNYRDFKFVIKNINNTPIYTASSSLDKPVYEGYKTVSPDIDQNNLNMAGTWTDNEYVCVKKLIVKLLNQSEFADLTITALDDGRGTDYDFKAADQEHNLFTGRISADVHRYQKEDPMSGKKSYHYFTCNLLASTPGHAIPDFAGFSGEYIPGTPHFELFNSAGMLIYKHVK